MIIKEETSKCCRIFTIHMIKQINLKQPQIDLKQPMR